MSKNRVGRGTTDAVGRLSGLTVDRTDGQMHPDDEADLLDFVGDVREAVRDVEGVATGMSSATMTAKRDMGTRGRSDAGRHRRGEPTLDRSDGYLHPDDEAVLRAQVGSLRGDVKHLDAEITTLRAQMARPGAMLDKGAIIGCLRRLRHALEAAEGNALALPQY